MSFIKFKRGKRDEVNKTSYQDGSILFSTDTKQLSVDYPNDEGTIIRRDVVGVAPDGYSFVLKNNESNIVKDDIIFNDDITIMGDLIVSGITTSIDTETLKVKDNLIVANSNGDLVQGGFAIMTSETDAYGILYVPGPNGAADGGVKIGLGTIDNDGVFTYTQDEAQFLATRADSITDGNLVQWDSTTRKLVDSGKSINDIPLILNMVPEFRKTYAEILENYNNKDYDYTQDAIYSVWYTHFNKQPVIGEVFVSTGKSNDGYVFGFKANILTEGNVIHFAFNDLVLYHEGNIDEIYATKNEVNKGYTQKITEPNQIYATNLEGETIGVSPSSNANPNTLAGRDENGIIRAVTVEDESVVSTEKDLVNRAYVQNNFIKKSQRGVANGIASLDENGRLPTAQLPEFAAEAIGGETEGEYFEFCTVETNEGYRQETQTTMISVQVTDDFLSIYNTLNILAIIFYTYHEASTNPADPYPAGYGQLDIEIKSISYDSSGRLYLTINGYAQQIPVGKIFYIKVIKSFSVDISGAKYKESTEDGQTLSSYAADWISIISANN